MARTYPAPILLKCPGKMLQSFCRVFLSNHSDISLHCNFSSSDFLTKLMQNSLFSFYRKHMVNRKSPSTLENKGTRKDLMAELMDSNQSITKTSLTEPDLLGSSMMDWRDAVTTTPEINREE